MRIAILWCGLSGYLNACLKEIASREGVELFVAHQFPVQQAPFNDNQFDWSRNRLVWESSAAYAPLALRLRAFDPEALVICGWHVPAYRRAARELAKRCWRVLAFDNPWEATLRQRLGALVAPWYVRPLADAAWIPGERQAVFARRLGFEQRAIIWGSLSCDQPAIETVHFSRLAEGRAVPRSFLFVGEFASHKGVDQLVKAYELYREKSIDPWPLVCCGAGPLGSLLEGRPGIRVKGFVQPDELRKTNSPQPDVWFCRATSITGESWSTRRPRQDCWFSLPRLSAQRCTSCRITSTATSSMAGMRKSSPRS